jgi:hypothetical protein
LLEQLAQSGGGVITDAAFLGRTLPDRMQVVGQSLSDTHSDQLYIQVSVLLQPSSRIASWAWQVERFEPQVGCLLLCSGSEHRCSSGAVRAIAAHAIIDSPLINANDSQSLLIAEQLASDAFVVTSYSSAVVLVNQEQHDLLSNLEANNAPPANQAIYDFNAGTRPTLHNVVLLVVLTLMALLLKER